MSFAIKPTNCKRCGKSLSMFEGRYCLECQKEIDKELEIYEGNTGVFDEPYPWRPDEIIGILKHIIEVADTSSCGVKEIDGIDEEAINNAITIIGSFEQIKWERDTAIAQLKELGYEFGEKIRTDDDYISRQAVIDAIDKWVKNMGVLIALPTSEVTPLFESIHELPSVNSQEQKVGHWILEVEDWNKWTCSNCGYSKRTDVHVTLGYDFCPKCGCKMSEVEV